MQSAVVSCDPVPKACSCGTISAWRVVSLGISDASCHVAGAQWGLDASILQTVLAVLVGVVVVAAWLAAFVTFRETRAVDKDEQGRAHIAHQGIAASQPDPATGDARV